MDIDLKEIEWYGFISMLMGIVLTLIGCFWDRFLGVSISHHEGYGSLQILWISFWGLYSFWSWSINLKWKSYNKQIHNLKG